MFEEDAKLENCIRKEKAAAFQRYKDAMSASIRVTGSVFIQRNTKDVFTNNFNRRIMGIH